MSIPNQNSEIRLKRVLGLPDLIIYGIILIQPIAALPLFGHANNLSKGHAVTSILIAMVAMIFTAISYGRMANKYPSAGSAYTYVGKGIHPYLGFITGWSMFMDYMLIPILCVIFTSISANHLLPFVPYYIWIFFFAVSFTILNLNGIKMAARTNWLLMIIMSAVVFWFMIMAVRYVIMKEGFTGLFSIKPFYNPESFSLGSIGSATALAALTYIGFDGLTTLSEEVKNPKRNVMIAVVLTCLITGIWSGSQVYLAQLSWPDWYSFGDGLLTEAEKTNALDTAIMAVARRIGGMALDTTLSIILLVGSIGSGITGQIGGARLLYGMGRDNVIPGRIFARLDKKHASPRYNIIIVGALALSGALLLNYEESARLINFGAFLAFMGVNIAAMKVYFFDSQDKSFKSIVFNFIPSLIGFIVSLIIWLNLPLKTFLIGGAWMVTGLIYLIFKTNGFKEKNPVSVFSS